MSKKPEKTIELPSGGGSYTRKPDGTLIKPKPAKLTFSDTAKDTDNGA